MLEEVAEFLREQPEEVVVLLVKRDWGARDYFDTQDRTERRLACCLPPTWICVYMPYVYVLYLSC